MREEIRAFADGADDLPSPHIAGARADRLHVVPGVVEGRPDQVVHRGVDDREVSSASRLEVENAREQHAGVADEIAAWLEQQALAAIAARALYCDPVGARVDRLGVAIADAEPAADVDVLERDAVGLDPVGQREELLGGLDADVEVGDLRADVAIDAAYLDVRQRCGAPVKVGASVQATPNLLSRRPVEM